MDPAAAPPVPASPDGDRRARFEREMLPHLDALYRVALRLTRSPADADDLVQDTMLKAYRGFDGFTPGTNAKGWLLTILRHAFINEYRRRSRRPETMDLDTAEAIAALPEEGLDDPRERFFEGLVDEAVLRAVDALPEAFREAVVLSDIEGLNYQETARVLGVPVGTVKSRLFRGRRLLKGRLYRYAVEMGYIKKDAT
jgi:RNA polymerase sigma-70 factor (ECF subfamily)